MTIVDRIFHDESPGIPAHEFAAVWLLYKDEDITKAQANAKFESQTIWGPMTTTETTDLNEWYSRVDATLTVEKIERVVILAQSDVITKAQAKTFLGITGG